MAPTTAHHEIAAFIDKEVSKYPDTAGGTEQLLTDMYKYMVGIEIRRAHVTG